MHRLYVIDDHEQMARAIAKVVSEEGRIVSTYTEAEPALREALRSRPDLIVTDISMPGMHGLDLIAELRKRYPAEELPIIVVSAVGIESTIDAAFAEGADDYILKPFNVQELKAKVRLHLGRAGGGAACGGGARGQGIGTFASYELVRVIGEGGMGTIYQAREMASGDVVALKVLSKEYLTDDEYRERFLREAQILKEVRHPNIVRFHDYRAFRGQPYIAMEYVDGKDLDALVEKRGPLHEHDALKVARQVLLALQYLDDRGYIHRDIKPHNIIVTAEGAAKVADFGLSLRHTDRRLTQRGIIIGTLDYLSPEQVRGSQSLDIRCDIFSLGTTLYFALAGKPPFEDFDENVVADKIITEPYPPLDNFGVRAAVARLVDRLTQKRRDDRPQSPAEAIAFLDRVADHAG